MTNTRVDWAAGTWTNPPVSEVHEGGDLLVTAAQGSDAWRTTAYGFVHESEHALVRGFTPDCAVEVSFLCELSEQFDQAGLMVRADPETWVKAGVELSDGVPQLGAVVTRQYSDWSVAPVPQWLGRVVTIRASRAGNALTIRARVDNGDWGLVRVCSWRDHLETVAGPHLAAPTRAGLTVRFLSWDVGEADVGLHEGVA